MERNDDFELNEWLGLIENSRAGITYVSGFRSGIVSEANGKRKRIRAKCMEGEEGGTSNLPVNFKWACAVIISLLMTWVINWFKLRWA